MKKRTLLILATAALLPALTACAPYDYSDRLSEVRSDLFIAQTEEFTLTLACVEREYPYADDGVPCPMTKTVQATLSPVTAPAGERYRDLEVEVAVYDKGDSGPGALLRSETFRPAYLNESMLGDFQETPKSLNRSQESFVRFSEPVSVGGTFYVGYRIKSAPEDTYFSAYSLPQGATARNTAWVRPEGGAWTRATDYARAGFATSLYVDPVVRYGEWVANEPVEAPGAEPIVSVGPGRGEVHIVLPEDMREASYALHAASGKRMAAGTIAGPRATLRLTPKERGVYILTISGEGKRYSRKIVL